jgi:hypothetical protein
MTSFVPSLLSPSASEPDPTKRVNYNLGMVLGVDDFTQEFAYLAGRDQWMARDLLGYGTVTGLDVGREIESGGPQVSVTQGVALSPRGRLIRVATAQCASLNGWLAAHHEELLGVLGSPSDNRASLRLFVVLGYRECPTDMVPIPGVPCRSEEETTAASRMADDFRLELRLEAPDQQEEDALRDFVAWLSQVEITDEVGGSMLTVAEFEDAIRSAAYLESSPPSSSPPDFMYGSPPEKLRIHTSLAYEYLRAAFRVWVTELRPRWQPRWVGKGQSCAGGGGDDCVMLAEVSFNVVRAGSGNDWQVENANAVQINEERRPYLLHLRMVQEWLLGERRSTPSEGAPSVVPGFTVAPETAYGQTPKAGVSLDYARADHTHGTPPPPSLRGDVTGSVDASTVERLRGVNIDTDAATPKDGQVLAYVASDNKWKPTNLMRAATTVAPETNYGQAAAVGTSPDYARADHTHGTPQAPTLGGEVTGPAGSNIVAKIQNTNVNQTKPSEDGQVLAYNKLLDKWEAKTLPAATPAPVASNTVTSENTFGQSSSAGSSTAYSRADHTHGTPQMPPLAGEVTGAFNATVVSKLQGASVSATPPTVAQSGQVLTYDGSKWAAAPLPATTPPPTPAGNVTASNIFGQASAVGSSTSYARADHTHGTPPAPPAPPPAASSVNAANSFGQSSSVGSSTSYARADHSHGTPSLPPLGGDVSGSLGGMTVVGIQSKSVEVFNPQPNDVLTYNGSAWQNARPGGTASNFVQHPAGVGGYSIVAAGIIKGDGTTRRGSYNNLHVVDVEKGRVLITFDGYDNPDDKDFEYIVKAMAVVMGRQAFVVNFEQFLPGDKGFTLAVMFEPNGTFVGVDIETLRNVELMVEVSQYGGKEDAPRI